MVSSALSLLGCMLTVIIRIQYNNKIVSEYGCLGFRILTTPFCSEIISTIPRLSLIGLLATLAPVLNKSDLRLHSMKLLPSPNPWSLAVFDRGAVAVRVTEVGRNKVLILYYYQLVRSKGKNIFSSCHNHQHLF